MFVPRTLESLGPRCRAGAVQRYLLKSTHIKAYKGVEAGLVHGSEPGKRSDTGKQVHEAQAKKNKIQRTGKVQEKAKQSTTQENMRTKAQKLRR